VTERERAERIRDRTARRHRRETTGLRRLRPGPGPGGAFYSPGMVGTAGTASRYRAMAELDLDREIELLVGALEELGPTGRDDLAAHLHARAWGPGRFRSALREAVDEGRATRQADERYSSAA
jgi:hypothetical protein